MNLNLSKDYNPNYNIDHLLLLRREHLRKEFLNTIIDEIEIDMFDDTLEIFHNGLGPASKKSFHQIFREIDLIIFVDSNRIKPLKSRFGDIYKNSSDPKPSFL